MFDRIAVPLDGSDIAARAIGPGRRLANVHGARLVLVTVATPAIGGTNRAHNVLAAGGVVAGDDVDTLVIDADDAASALAAFDADHPATLMCMTTRGHGALRRKLLGGVALAVVRDSPHAVVLVGPRCNAELDTAIDPIIVCLDGTNEAEVVLPWATRWARSTDAALLLMHVVYPFGPPEVRVPPSRQLVEQLDYLPKLSQQLRAEHIDVRHITIPTPTPPQRCVTRSMATAMRCLPLRPRTPIPSPSCSWAAPLLTSSALQASRCSSSPRPTPPTRRSTNLHRSRRQRTPMLRPSFQDLRQRTPMYPGRRRRLHTEAVMSPNRMASSM
jgi:nucleotide-binding universal stress UspA family protein